MMKKKALITGITGQDGSYLAELLLQKGYQIIGMVSATNDIGSANIDHIKSKLILESGDLLDKHSIDKIIKKYCPDEIYNLAGITFVPISWDKPELVHNVNSLGVLRILTAIRDFSPHSRFFQATSSKIFGDAYSRQEKNIYYQDLTTIYNPKEPYGVSKLTAHESVRIFREHFNIFAVSGILYNHESVRRGIEFVTRKITKGAVDIKKGIKKELFLGNLDAKADWGYAPDYVKAMWLMLQNNKPHDYIISTGKINSVRDICHIAFNYLDLDYKKYVKINKNFYRPFDKIYLGDSSKIIKELNWQISLNFKQMIIKMVEYDLNNQ